MIIKELRENQRIHVPQGENLEIHCNVPKGVRIELTDGNLQINGNVGKDVKIVAKRRRLVNIHHNGGHAIADYAIAVPGGIRFVGGVELRNAWPEGNNIVVGGRRFPIPTVRNEHELKGKVTIRGNIDETVNIIARGNVVVNGKPMIVQSEPELSERNIITLFNQLLRAEDHYPNKYLFNYLLDRMEPAHAADPLPLQYRAPSASAHPRIEVDQKEAEELANLLRDEEPQVSLPRQEAVAVRPSARQEAVAARPARRQEASAARSSVPVLNISPGEILLNIGIGILTELVQTAAERSREAHRNHAVAHAEWPGPLRELHRRRGEHGNVRTRRRCRFN